MGAQDSVAGGITGQDGSYKDNPGSRILFEAVVVDCYSNPAAMTSDEKNLLRGGPSRVNNTAAIDKMPRNSIKAKIISDGAGASGTAAIFYPLFSPHLCMPVKPGEQVWVIFEAGSESQGFWVSRISSNYSVDDLNYTHRDRDSLNEIFKNTTLVGTADHIPKVTDDPIFNNGKIQKSGEVRTLPGKNDYETYFESAISKKEFVAEAVPRFTKAAPTLALQGSNNTLITLGTETTEGVVSEDVPLQGAIDIVVGRTAPTVITNARGLQETDKNKYLEGSPNTDEGKVDFEGDSARVFLTMSTGGDVKYGSTIDTIGDTATPSSDGSAAIVKADNTRITTRAGGNVSIVANGANIHIDSSGNVQIVTAGTISMGTSGGDLQPFVRGDDLADELQSLVDAIAGALTTPTPAGGDGGTAAFGAALTSFQTYVPDLATFKSGIIKGE